MSKIGVIGDIHLSSSEKYGRHSTELLMNTRTKDKLNILDWACSKFISAKVDDVVFLGDIFETLTPSERLRSEFAFRLSDLITQKIAVWVILGNHDTNLRSLHSLMTVESLGLDEITIVNDIAFLEEDTLLVAYGAEEKMMDILTNKDAPMGHPYSIDYLFGHLPFKPHFPDGLNIDDVKKCVRKRIINGHYHHQDEDHIGSMCVYRRDEIGEEHVVGILDTMTNEFERIPVIDRKFVKFDFTVEELNQFLEDGIDEQSEDYVVSIKVTDTPENLAAVSVRNVRSTFSKALKVVVDKEVLADSKTIYRDKKREFNDIDEDMKIYCDFKKRTDMLNPGKGIVDEVKSSDNTESVLI